MDLIFLQRCDCECMCVHTRYITWSKQTVEQTWSTYNITVTTCISRSHQSLCQSYDGKEIRSWRTTGSLHVDFLSIKITFFDYHLICISFRLSSTLYIVNFSLCRSIWMLVCARFQKLLNKLKIWDRNCQERTLNCTLKTTLLMRNWNKLSPINKKLKIRRRNQDLSGKILVLILAKIVSCNSLAQWGGTLCRPRVWKIK